MANLARARALLVTLGMTDRAKSTWALAAAVEFVLLSLLAPRPASAREGVEYRLVDPPSDKASSTSPKPDASRGPPLAANHAIYFELGGSAFNYSLNYEYRPWSAVSLRLGLGALVLEREEIPLAPLFITFLPFPGDFQLEFGAGAIVPVEGPAFTLFGAAVGLRYHPRDGGALWRLTWTPIGIGDQTFAAWFGGSVGVAL